MHYNILLGKLSNVDGGEDFWFFLCVCVFLTFYTTFSVHCVCVLEWCTCVDILIHSCGQIVSP